MDPFDYLTHHHPILMRLLRKTQDIKICTSKKESSAMI